jgi:hypothetical protein
MVQGIQIASDDASFAAYKTPIFWNNPVESQVDSNDKKLEE